VYACLVATVVCGDFEWDDAKADSNLAKHGVAFVEAVLAMKDPLSLDFEDLVEPANLITLAATPAGVPFTSSPPNETVAFTHQRTRRYSS
jgi:hypothetical protein